MFPNKICHSSCVSDLSLSSHNLYDVQQKIKGSLINKSSDFGEKWRLQRAFQIDNKTFNREFIDKRSQFQNTGSHYSQWEIRYGFLATIKESMIHKVAEEGLEVRLCPYNYFGHNISGIHISQNADVCMNEASKKVTNEDEVILIVFKYMLGKHKVVPMFDPKVLLAPTPNFDSHLCEDRPDPTEKYSNQYIKSLVYLYEFDNVNLDPIVRPRQCCPIAALVFKQNHLYQQIDLTGSEPVESSVPIYTGDSTTFLKPPTNSNWSRDMLLETTPSIVIQKNERDDSRKVLLADYNETPYQQPSFNDDLRTERWEPILRDYDNYNVKGFDVPDNGVRTRGRLAARMGTVVQDVAYQERDRSLDRLKQWRSGYVAGGGGGNGVHMDSGYCDTSDPWFNGHSNNLGEIQQPDPVTLQVPIQQRIAARNPLSRNWFR